MNNWNDGAVELLVKMSLDDTQILLPSIAGTLSKAFPDRQVRKQRLEALLLDLLSKSAYQTPPKSHRLLELAAFLEDGLEKSSDKPMRYWADRARNIEIQRSTEVLRLFAAAARSNRLSQDLTVAAKMLLEIYTADGLELNEDEGQYAAEALGACVRLISKNASAMEEAMGETKLKSPAIWLIKLNKIFTTEQFRRLISEIVTTLTDLEMRSTLEILADAPSPDRGSLTKEWSALLSNCQQPAWLFL